MALIGYFYIDHVSSGYSTRPSNAWSLWFCSVDIIYSGESCADAWIEKEVRICIWFKVTHIACFLTLAVGEASVEMFRSYRGFRVIILFFNLLVISFCLLIGIKTKSLPPCSISKIIIWYFSFSFFFLILICSVNSLDLSDDGSEGYAICPCSFLIRGLQHCIACCDRLLPWRKMGAPGSGLWLQIAVSSKQRMEQYVLLLS